MGTCAIKRCRQETDIVYYGREVCEKHWDLHCKGGLFNLKNELKVKENE